MSNHQRLPGCKFPLTSELSSPYPGTHPLLLRYDLREISQSFSPLELSILNHPYRILQLTILIFPPIAHAMARNEMRYHTYQRQHHSKSSPTTEQKYVPHAFPT